MFGASKRLIYFIPFYNNKPRFNIIVIIDNCLSNFQSHPCPRKSTIHIKHNDRSVDTYRFILNNPLSVYVPVRYHQYVARLLRSGGVEYLHDVPLTLYF